MTAAIMAASVGYDEVVDPLASLGADVTEAMTSPFLGQGADS